MRVGERSASAPGRGGRRRRAMARRCRGYNMGIRAGDGLGSCLDRGSRVVSESRRSSMGHSRVSERIGEMCSLMPTMRDWPLRHLPKYVQFSTTESSVSQLDRLLEEVTATESHPCARGTIVFHMEHCQWIYVLTRNLIVESHLRSPPFPIHQQWAGYHGAPRSRKEE